MAALWGYYNDYAFDLKGDFVLKKLLFIAMFFCLVLTACVSDSSQESIIQTPETLNDILSLALTRREGIIRPSYDHIIQLTDGRTSLEIDLRRLIWPRVILGDIPMDDLLNDTIDFFHILAGAYGPYLYFGGDEVFLPIRDAIIEVIGTQPYWNQQEFASLLQYSLSKIIIDGHFSIDGINLQANYMFFTYDGRFDLSVNGFVCKFNGLYVKELLLPCRPDTIIDLNDAFRLSMDENGAKFFYSPVVVLYVGPDEAYPNWLTIVYEDGTMETVNLEALVTDWFGGWDTNPSLDFIYGVPVIAIRGMGPVSSPFPNAQGGTQFLAYAKELRGEPVLILDLRGNMGGHADLPRYWFYNLTGEIISANFHHLALRSLDPFMRQSGVDPTLDGRLIEFDDKHRIEDVPPERIVSNNQLIIMIVDRFTGSSAEYMVDMAFNMENTLVVGHNTGGFLLGSRMQMHLPRSGVTIFFSGAILIHPEGHFQEGIGFAPDIWVTGCALTAALGLIENHFSGDL